MLYFLQLQYIMRRLSGDTQAGTETCVALPLSSKFNLSQQRRILFTTRFRCVCVVEMINYNFTYCSHWQGGDGGENRVGDVRPCLITCLQMVSGLCQCKDYRDKEQLTLLSPPDRVDSWVGLIGTADKRIPIQIYTKYIALQYTLRVYSMF